jgi:truncated hemoglobin YjbI
MYSQDFRKFYSPRFSEMAWVSVKRLAWSFKKTMPQTIDMVVRFLGFFFASEKVCISCQDRSKCRACAFNRTITEEEKTAFLESL